LNKEKKIFFLSTDTFHHRYIIKFFEQNNFFFQKYIFETSHVKPKFKISPFFEKETFQFEKKMFFKNFSYKIDESKIFKTKNINSVNFEKYLNNEKPDIGIVFGTRKINKKIISKFKYGLINVHRGIINKYRGLDSDLWAIYHNDLKNIGVAIHKIDENLDTGNVIEQKKIQISSNTKIYQLRYYTTVLAAKMLLKAIKTFYTSSKLTKVNIKNTGRYYSFMPLTLKKTLLKNFN
jgi:methionyl-tRNA formyltransferase